MFNLLFKIVPVQFVASLALIGCFTLGAEVLGADLDDGLWVEVEPTHLIPDVSTRQGFQLLPYRERRPKWNSVFSISVSGFHPVYYDPDFVSVNFETLYGENVQYSPEIQWTYKRNTGIGSFGLDLGLAYYQTSSLDQVEIGDALLNVDSQLTIVVARLGFSLSLDTLLPSEPYVVPYLAGGLYTAYYRETQASLSFNGTTQVAPYFSGGVRFQLDWIDPMAAREAYFNSGINNSFLFAEARKMMASQAEKDPDLETDLFWLAGLSLEF